MLPFIGGFVVGGLVGFFLCAILHINRFAGLNSFNHAKHHDRRVHHKATFPLTDLDGVLVHVDRRIQPDRRLRGSIHGT
jgi:hypothetical protein